MHESILHSEFNVKEFALTYRVTDESYVRFRLFVEVLTFSVSIKIGVNLYAVEIAGGGESQISSLNLSIHFLTSV